MGHIRTCTYMYTYACTDQNGQLLQKLEVIFAYRHNGDITSLLLFLKAGKLAKNDRERELLLQFSNCYSPDAITLCTTATVASNRMTAARNSQYLREYKFGTTDVLITHYARDVDSQPVYSHSETACYQYCLVLHRPCSNLNHRQAILTGVSRTLHENNTRRVQGIDKAVSVNVISRGVCTFAEYISSWR